MIKKINTIIKYFIKIFCFFETFILSLRIIYCKKFLILKKEVHCFINMKHNNNIKFKHLFNIEAL